MEAIGNLTRELRSAFSWPTHPEPRKFGTRGPAPKSYTHSRQAEWDDRKSKCLG